MSLRLRITIAIAVLILLLGVAGTLHARFTLSDISEDEVEKRGIALASYLKNYSAELLLTNDNYGLYRHIAEALAVNDDVRYIVIFDAKGSVSASTFAQGLPQGLREANSVSSGQAFSLRTVETSEGKVLDVASSVLDGAAGTIRLGILMRPTENRVERLTFTLLSLTGGVLLAGLLLAYVLATFLTRPLARLGEAARAVGQGDLSQRVTVAGPDEVRRLADAFNAMTDRLRQKEEDRRRLLERVISVEEAERKRIARELHDEAGQALTSLLLGLRHLEESSPDPATRRATAEMRALASETIGQIHDLALDLRPSILDDLGLVPALERCVADYARKHGIVADFHADGLRDGRMPQQQETALYRIAQEALTNAARHAEASTISVLLERRGDTIALIIQDDGKGFDVDSVPTHRYWADRLGLLGMAERASLVGGRLSIESQMGHGTAVFVEVPARTSDGTYQNPHS